MSDFAAFIMRGRMHAILVAGLFGIFSLKVLPFGLLSAAVLGLVALRRGWPEGVVVAVGAAVLVWAGWFMMELRPGLKFPLVFALWLPLLFAAEALRRTESQGLALIIVGLAAAAFVVVMHLVTGDVVAFWQAWLMRTVAAVPGATVQGFEREGTLRLMNGLVAGFYGMGLMLSLLCARWLQSLLYNPGGFGPEFRRLRLPRLALPVVVGALWAAGAVNVIMVADLLIVGMMMYFFVGLAVIHGLVAMRGMHWGWLAPPYLALIFAFVYAVVGLALIGATDALIDFRARARKR
ncbi:uncharacterized protein sS8_0592 [Methylocaldum marinum]|uniref:DUF2232 domain-containing protein n=1 Tax=Methylocaldum marinum TaxID=1432792 RepID=A0A250KLU8_9GAMM|nr:hypothetical protein [Methylocaldum marinum]BBA32557.1 uncharacterized protein sS8_0592 [Methylocaldum marinum]